MHDPYTRTQSRRCSFFSGHRFEKAQKGAIIRIEVATSGALVEMGGTYKTWGLKHCLEDTAMRWVS